MAWSPTPEVAAARDAAKKLGDAPVCVVVYVTPDGTKLGCASYGKTPRLCADAKQLAEHLLEAARHWGG